MLIRTTVASPMMRKFVMTGFGGSRSGGSATTACCHRTLQQLFPRPTVASSSKNIISRGIVGTSFASSTGSSSYRISSSLFLSNYNVSLLLKNNNIPTRTISAAILTTHSDPPIHRFVGSSSLVRRGRSSKKQSSIPPPFPPAMLLQHQQMGPLAYFSSSGGGGAPGGGGGGPPRMGRGMGWGGMLGVGAVLLGKGKYILAALKLTKLMPLASMLLSVGAYTMVFGFPYACGIVGLLFVHETGHLLVMNHYGIPFSPMVFLPFMGAAVAMKEHPRDAWQDAMIAFGGPALGTAGTAGVAVAATMTESQLLYALAEWGYMVNMFNMLPIGSMDGGRITSALSPYAGVAGLAMGGGLILNGMISNPIFYIVMLAGGWSTFERFYDPAGHAPPNFYKITPMQRGIIGASYVGLIGTMMFGMAANAVNKKSPEEIQRYQELHFEDSKFETED